MNAEDQSKLHQHASECYERFKASFVSTYAGVVLPTWHALDPEVRGRWVAAVGSLHEAAMERDAVLLRLCELEGAVADARAALPDMLALTALAAPFAETVGRLQRALDDAAVKGDAPPRLRRRSAAEILRDAVGPAKLSD